MHHCNLLSSGRSPALENLHSSHDLSRPEAKRFRVKLANLNIPKIDLEDAEDAYDYVPLERRRKLWHGSTSLFL
jgi:hypothetical protein